MNSSLKKIISLGLIFIMLLSASCTQTGEKEPLTKETEETTTVEQTVTTAKETTPSKTEETTAKPVEVEIPVSGTFYSKTILENIQKNCEELLEFKAAKQIAINAAKKYLELDYDELWGWIYGPELDRSWMVLSDGICPSCRQPVIMYDWIINPQTNPWKLQCPKCKEFFPKNDFYAYYRSGLDESGRFSHDRADKSLLYNMETGDKNDKFGVDDGNGYIEDGKVFRFIQTYLVYGQWKRQILDAIKTLSDAYIYTQETEYAVRTLILLDRLADFWPEYDYNEQGWLYERIGTCAGYLSYRIDAAFEAYDLALAYDKVVEVLFKEPFVCEYLSEKAKITGVENKKETPYDIKRNIDERILKDIVNNQDKILSNAPYTELAVMACLGVLNWENNREYLENTIADIIKENTKYDGMTGESGLAGYATMGKSAIAKMCNLFTLADPDFIEKMYNRVPKLYDAYRFHIDLRCVNKYYPILGDVSYFGSGVSAYPASGGLENLMLYKLYELTGDEDLIRVIWINNGYQSRGAFSNFVTLDNLSEKMKVVETIGKANPKIELGSVRKDEYQIAVLRTGEHPDATEVWINFGTNKISHSHGDGMNIGIYYQDADLMPDNGYPNVSYGGGWSSDVVSWFTGTASHNVIAFNNQRQSRANGTCTLWSIGDVFKVFRANAPGMFSGVQKYERTLALVDINMKNTYLLDVFRVGNGPAGSYEKYNRSNIANFSTEGLTLEETERTYPKAVYMSNFQKSVETDEVWVADWALTNYFNVFSYAYALHLKMTDLTRDENVYICDTWLPPSMELKSRGHEGFQLPTVITERTVEAGEVATFVSILEPFSRESKILSAKRLGCVSVADNTDHDENAAVLVETTNQRKDIIVLLDGDLDQELLDVIIDTEIGQIETNCQSLLIRLDQEGKILMIRASRGDYVRIKGEMYAVSNTDEVTEYDFDV
jgi:hypothetical protein